MKIIRTLKLFSAIGIIALLSLSFTQNEVNDENDWTILKTENGVSVSVKIETCGPGSWYVFKFENLTNNEIEIDYNVAVKESVAFGPAKGSISIRPNSFLTGTCQDVFKYSLPHNQDGVRSINEAIEVQIIKK